MYVCACNRSSCSYLYNTGNISTSVTQSWLPLLYCLFAKKWQTQRGWTGWEATNYVCAGKLQSTTCCLSGNQSHNYCDIRCSIRTVKRLAVCGYSSTDVCGCSSTRCFCLPGTLYVNRVKNIRENPSLAPQGPRLVSMPCKRKSCSRLPSPTSSAPSCFRVGQRKVYREFPTWAKWLLSSLDGPTSQERSGLTRDFHYRASRGGFKLTLLFLLLLF